MVIVEVRGPFPPSSTPEQREMARPRIWTQVKVSNRVLKDKIKLITRVTGEPPPADVPRKAQLKRINERYDITVVYFC
jgi:hypothetical protein